MIGKNEIKKIIGTVLHAKGNSLENHQIMHPVREWLVGLLIGFIVLGFGIFWSLDNYAQYNEVSLNDEIGSADVVVYRESIVKAAQADFAERVNEYERLKKELSEFASEDFLLEEEGDGLTEVVEEGGVLSEENSNESPAQDVVPEDDLMPIF
jgi:hypothetical protein